MNQDKDNLLVLRVENDPPMKVEVRRVARPEPGAAVEMTEAQYKQYMQARQQALSGLRAMTLSEQRAYSGAASAQQAASPLGSIFGGIG